MREALCCFSFAMSRSRAAFAFASSASNRSAASIAPISAWTASIRARCRSSRAFSSSRVSTTPPVALEGRPLDGGIGRRVGRPLLFEGGTGASDADEEAALPTPKAAAAVGDEGSRGGSPARFRSFRSDGRSCRAPPVDSPEGLMIGEEEETLRFPRSRSALRSSISLWAAAAAANECEGAEAAAIAVAPPLCGAVLEGGISSSPHTIASHASHATSQSEATSANSGKRLLPPTCGVAANNDGGAARLKNIVKSDPSRTNL